jgi:hypothetical protein
MATYADRNGRVVVPDIHLHRPAFSCAKHELAMTRNPEKPPYEKAVSDTLLFPDLRSANPIP